MAKKIIAIAITVPLGVPVTVVASEEEGDYTLDADYEGEDDAGPVAIAFDMPEPSVVETEEPVVETEPEPVAETADEDTIDVPEPGTPS